VNGIDDNSAFIPQSMSVGPSKFFVVLNQTVIVSLICAF